MTTTRKPHVRVPQDAYLEAAGTLALAEANVADYAQHFNVSQGTARRNLDGLVAQGLLIRRDHWTGRVSRRTYALPAVDEWAIARESFRALQAQIAELETFGVRS